MTLPTSPLTLMHRVADLFASLPQVEAVALGGSSTSGHADADSDVDLYVYTNAEVPLEERRSIVERAGGASRVELGLTLWGPSDSWIAADGTEMDVTYFGVGWLEEQLERVWERHEASLGYSTSFWYTVRHSRMLHDPNGWFGALQEKGRQDLPDALRNNIIALNHPVLRNVIPSYSGQLEKAVARRDLISVNHRAAALLASYFDVVFALNRTLHPGEKRLLALARAHCEKLPADMEAGIGAVLQASATANETLLEHVKRLLDRLDALLEQEGFVPATSQPNESGDDPGV